MASSSEVHSKIPSMKLNDGSTIPLIAYGTGTALFKSSALTTIDRTTVSAIKTALSLGIHHLDGAELYNTEPEIGLAIKESGIPRRDLFITTKVIHNIKNISSAIDASLQKLGLEYVDLYLIHSPWFAGSDEELRQAWREMEDVKREGKARNIGVSNYLQRHLEVVLEIADVVPAVNQVEFHPYLQREGLLPWCKGKGIVVEAFGPLTTITKARPGPVDEVLMRLAAKYGVCEEAVALRWCVEMGAVAVTTSRREERLKGYLQATGFELTKEEVEEISKRGKEKHFRGNNFMHQYPPDDRS